MLVSVNHYTYRSSTHLILQLIPNSSLFEMCTIVFKTETIFKIDTVQLYFIRFMLYDENIQFLWNSCYRQYPSNFNYTFDKSHVYLSSGPVNLF